MKRIQGYSDDDQPESLKKRVSKGNKRADQS